MGLTFRVFGNAYVSKFRTLLSSNFVSKKNLLANSFLYLEFTFIQPHSETFGFKVTSRLC